ncbi:hypothetical protein ACFFX0_19930 [Citricoccus parietis]|uniref:Uncharacterized protein n=1 Tax=Citricoccus parietis TaxID=592307 RepID=A0ABV5G333_9MICC
MGRMPDRGPSPNVVRTTVHAHRRGPRVPPSVASGRGPAPGAGWAADLHGARSRPVFRGGGPEGPAAGPPPASPAARDRPADRRSPGLRGDRHGVPGAAGDLEHPGMGGGPAGGAPPVPGGGVRLLDRVHGDGLQRHHHRRAGRGRGQRARRA